MEKDTVLKITALQKNGVFKKADKITHVVIIPTYKEDKEILEETIGALTKVNFPLDRIILILATEERDRARAEINADYLLKKFGGIFGAFHHFMHPMNLPDEIPAKGANITYSGRQITKILKEKGVDFTDVLVTTLDADNRPHPSYFANLTYHYLLEPNRSKRSYQPLSFFYNNIWEVPFTNRIVGLANSFWYLSESCEPNHLFNASVYAQSLDTLVAMDYWSRHTIVEDLHQFWRAYFHFNGDHEVIPLFIPVYQDSLQNKTYFTSLVGQYKQLRRWAWGASEIPYVIMKMWKKKRDLPFFKNVFRLSYMCYLQIMWATGPVIILFNKSIPMIINHKFSNSLFAYNLNEILGVIFTLMMIGIITSLWVTILSLPKPTGPRPRFQFFTALLQYFLLPLVTIFYGAIPALDAQTRLMLGKRLGFSVTEKVRRTV